MYLRHSSVKRNGKKRTYWRLVRSVRQGKKVRQETVAFLGELDAKGRAKASALARRFLRERADQLDLFEDRSEIEPVAVRLREVEVERGRTFGDVWLGYQLWRALELDTFCAKVMENGRQKIGWADIAMILVIARLCEPSSELHIAEDWYRRTALEDILGIPPECVHHTRLYEGLDKLLPHKEELEMHLKNRLGQLFELEYDLLLYDVTSTYFEGEAKSNPLAQYGYSRDRRPDCKQVCIGLVVTREGFPIGYEVFEGNRNDMRTLEEVVERMESRYGKCRRVWVMDRGMASVENIEWLQEGERKYVVGTPKSELKKWERELIERDGWSEIRDGLEVKLCRGPGVTETLILCRSEDRQEKERAMHERFSERIRAGLEKLAQRLEKPRKAERSQVERQIGRLMGRNSRAAGRFQVKVKEDSSRRSGLKLECKENAEWSEWAALTEGTYILRSNVTDWTPEELWQVYMQLTEAEAAFRIQKSELKIRPVWHQKEERVRAAHFQDTYSAFGMENALITMVTAPEMFAAVNQRIVDFYLRANEYFFEATRGHLDAILIGNDYGSQTGLMIAPDAIREFAYPGTYSIYCKDNTLFAYFEYTGSDFDADMEKMAADPTTQKWWDTVKPLMQPLETREAGEFWATMQEIYHLD